MFIGNDVLPGVSYSHAGHHGVINLKPAGLASHWVLSSATAAKNLTFTRTRHERMVTLIAMMMCAYGVITFLGPFWYTNSDRLGWRVWHMICGMANNYILNTFYSVVALLQLGADLQQLRSGFQGAALVLNKWWWAWCASDIDVSLVKSVPWWPSTGTSGLITMFFFFLSYMPMNVPGVQLLFEGFLFPALHKVADHFLFLTRGEWLPGSLSYHLQCYQRRRILMCFKKDFVDAAITALKRARKSQAKINPEGSVFDVIYDHSIAADLIQKQIQNDINNPALLQENPWVSRSECMGSILLTGILYFSCLSYYYNVIPDGKNLYRWSVAGGAIFAFTGISILMAQDTSSGIVGSVEDMHHGITPVQFVTQKNKILFFAMQLLAFGFSSFTYSGILDLNKLLKPNVSSEMVYSFINILSIIGATFFNGKASSMIVLGMQKNACLQRALYGEQDQQNKNGYRRVHYYDELLKKVSGMSVDDAFNTLIDMDACADEGRSIFDAPHVLRMMSEQYNIETSSVLRDMCVLVRQQKSMSANAFIRNKTARFTPQKSRQSAATMYVAFGLVPIAVTWISSMVFNQIKHDHNGFGHFMLTKILPYFCFTLMSVIVKGYRQYKHHHRYRDTKINITEPKTKEQNWVASIFPVAAGAVTDMAMSISIGLVFGINDQRKIDNISKGIGVGVAAMTASL